jgi:hypothetical protein
LVGGQNLASVFMHTAIITIAAGAVWTARMIEALTAIVRLAVFLSVKDGFV